MADNYNIYKQCLRCNGIGEISINGESYDSGSPSNITCLLCKGEGKLF